MSKKLKWASGTAVAATLFTALITASGSGAMAEEKAPTIIEEESATTFVSQPVVQEVPETAAEEAAQDMAFEQQIESTSARSLYEHVGEQPSLGDLSPEMKCLAGAIYFESRGESLDGQLAVGRVIVERAASSRFPNSYCGVVFQRSQFSFVRGNRMPSIRKGSKAWRTAVAMAQIAHNGTWESPTEGALFFHATYVSPRWRLTRLARVDNHIFYR